MNRGRSYRQVPMARRRFNKKIVWVCLLALGLIVGVAGLTVYFVQSNQNRIEQQALSSTHREALGQNQTQVSEVDVLLTAPIQTSTVAPTAEASLPSDMTGATGIKPFFQVIGLIRKDFKPILRRNTDAVGWITIEGLVDQPIVYRDNTFYLDHDFDQQKNVCGTVFLDENHPLRADSQNLLIYGHNMKDESMFGMLAKYMKNNFLHTHYQLTFETRFEVFSYLIFAVDRVSMDVNASNFLYFWGYPSFADKKAFLRYIDDVYQHSLYTRFLDVNESDTLLTLVTCVGSDRLVLFARRQRASDTDESIQKALLGLYLQ